MKCVALLPLVLSACAAGYPPGEVRVVDASREPGDAALAMEPAEEPRETEALPASQAPEDSIDLAKRGELAWRGHRPEEALELFERALAEAPENQRPIYERLCANTFLVLRRFSEAEAIYRRLISEGGLARDSIVHSLVQSNLAHACLRQDRPGEARIAAEKAIELDPRNFEALKTLGLIDLAEGKRDKARERLETALAMKEEIPEAQAALAQIEAESGDRAGALKRYQRLLERLPAVLPGDYTRRWRDLFHPEQTAVELKARMAALESSSESKS